VRAFLMMHVLGDESLWQLIVQTDRVTKLVLGSLCAVSIICLAIILLKLYQFSTERRGLLLLEKKLHDVREFKDIQSNKAFFELSNSGMTYYSVLGHLAAMLGVVPKDLPSSGSITPQQFDFLEHIAGDEIDQVISSIESRLPFLGTCAAVSPLVGLFGTIWGLIHSFMEISAQHSADIAVVAPGIAEALLTTLAGLIVAIPALIFYQYFSNEARKLEGRLVALVDRCMFITQQAFIGLKGS
jgi:biopolymer transport protein TolQ